MCPKQSTLGVPKGDGCYEVCTSGPFVDAGKSQPEHEYQIVFGSQLFV
jgi:hypothetical protein